jgi:hypothetical protein
MADNLSNQEKLLQIEKDKLKLISRLEARKKALNAEEKKTISI